MKLPQFLLRWLHKGAEPTSPEWEKQLMERKVKRFNELLQDLQIEVNTYGGPERRRFERHKDHHV